MVEVVGGRGRGTLGHGLVELGPCEDPGVAKTAAQKAVVLVLRDVVEDHVDDLGLVGGLLEVGEVVADALDAQGLDPCKDGLGQAAVLDDEAPEGRAR